MERVFVLLCREDGVALAIAHWCVLCISLVLVDNICLCILIHHYVKMYICKVVGWTVHIHQIKQEKTYLGRTIWRHRRQIGGEKFAVTW